MNDGNCCLFSIETVSKRIEQFFCAFSRLQNKTKMEHNEENEDDKYDGLAKILPCILRPADGKSLSHSGYFLQFDRISA